MSELPKEEEKSLSDCCLKFTLTLVKEILKDSERNSNVCVSPVSLTLALSMLYAGAGNVTKEELKTVLHLESFADDSTIHTNFQKLLENLMNEQKENLEIDIVNRLYAKEGMDLIRTFQMILQNSYNSDIVSVSFNEETREQINEWVESKTNKKIHNFIEERNYFNAMTGIFLVNAVYFKGRWESSFEGECTGPGEFYVDSKTVIIVDMMFDDHFYNYSESKEMKCTIVGKNYINNNLEMIVLLPAEVNGLVELEKSLSAESLNKLIGSLQLRLITLYMPKFKIEWGMPLKNILSKLGTPSLFSSLDADLSGISSDKGLFIDSVVHKTFIEVNEIGTEAAAATGCKGAFCSETPIIKINHPFLFLIQEKQSGTIIFMGRVSKP